MSTRRRWHLAALAAVAALVVAGCGGGNTDSPLATRVISFGDSLSDIGTYAPATSVNGPGTGAPYFGGKFTTNTHTGYTTTSNTSTANIWVEWISARLGVPITPAQAGFAGQSVMCPVTLTNPALAGSCTGYGQGGSRVTDPNGIGHSGGALTVPITAQMDNFLTRFTGYGGGDIVFVLGGDNDIFYWAGAVGQAAATPDQATAAVALAGTELATLVKDKVLANGAKRVVVLTAVDPSVAAGYAAAPAQTKALLTGLTTAFNSALSTGLQGADVRLFDTNAVLARAIASPSSFGLSNVTTAACDPATISAITGGQVTDGSSLFCNATAGAPFNGLKTDASPSTWLFADGVHPTTGGHRILADQVWAALKDFGWVPDNL